MEQVCFDEHFDGGEGHGDASLHVEGSGTPETASAQPAGHGFERAERPNRVQMAEEQEGLGGGVCIRTPEAEFEDIGEAGLTVGLDAATQLLATRDCEGEAGIDG